MLELESACRSATMARDTSGAVGSNQLFGQLKAEPFHSLEGFGWVRMEMLI